MPYVRKGRRRGLGAMCRNRQLDDGSNVTDCWDNYQDYITWTQAGHTARDPHPTTAAQLAQLQTNSLNVPVMSVIPPTTQAVVPVDNTSSAVAPPASTGSIPRGPLPPVQAPPAVTLPPVLQNAVSSITSRMPSFLTQSLVLGLPNWVLLGGVGALWWFGRSGR